MTYAPQSIGDARLDDAPLVGTALNPSVGELIRELADVAAMFSAEQARLGRDDEETFDPLLVELGRRQLAILAELKAREVSLRRAIASRAARSVGHLGAPDPPTDQAS